MITRTSRTGLNIMATCDDDGDDDNENDGDGEDEDDGDEWC